MKVLGYAGIMSIIMAILLPIYLYLKTNLKQKYIKILNKKLLDPSFRRIIADKVVKTEKLKTGEGHRPSYLFKYKGK